MEMRIVGMIAVLACSCGPSSAIEVVVEMPDGDPNLLVDEVRLYVGLGDPLNERKDGSGNLLEDVIIPRGYTPLDPIPKGFFWKRDVPSSPDQDRAPLEGGEVHFTFQPGTVDRITIVAVGYHAGAATAAALLEDAEMETGAVRQYHVILAPATAPLPATKASPVTVQEWGADPAARDCVHYTDPDHSIYIVLHGDRDCDGRIEQDNPANNECRVGVFDGYRRPGRGSLSCTTIDNIGVNPGMCVLGGDGCMEVPSGKACPLPGNTCLDPDVCARCTIATAQNNLDCISELASTPNAVPRIECTFEYTRLPFATCPGAATFQNGERFSRVNASCDTTQDFLFYAEGAGKWAPAFTVQGMTITAMKPTSNCDFQLAATTAVPTAPTALAPIFGIASGPLANGRSLAMPIAITFAETTGCDGVKNTCHFANVTLPAPAPLTSCLMRANPDPW
jgi:hypothetical protein